MHILSSDVLKFTTCNYRDHQPSSKALKPNVKTHQFTITCNGNLC
jgi:hypothetical protein